MAIEVRNELESGQRFVYAYYGGIDKIAHERGFGDFYDAELRVADRLVGDLLEVLPSGAVLLVTADHGQVEVGNNIITPSAELLSHGVAPVRRGKVPLVARPPWCRPTSCSLRRSPSSGTRRGSTIAGRSSTTVGSGDR